MATNNGSTYLTSEDLLKLAEEINCGPLTEALRSCIYEVEIDQSKSAFENLPDVVLGEAYDSTMGMPIPAALANAGSAYNAEVTHKFKRENKCPYFQKTELCALDGRLCLYDTETFPVCPRYKEGFTRGIPGLDGNKPGVQPSSEMPRDPVADQLPFANQFNRQ